MVVFVGLFVVCFSLWYEVVVVISVSVPVFC